MCTIIYVYLAEYVRIGVILQKHCGCACIIVTRSNVQRRKADFPFGAIVDEQGYDILMSLLKSHGERSKSILQAHRRALEDRLTHAEKIKRDVRREAHENKTEWKHSEVWISKGWDSGIWEIRL